jgi:tetratricopeptide (TPR) repeat protein
MRLTKHFIVFALFAASLGAAQTGAELATAGRLAEAAQALEQELSAREQLQPADPLAVAHALNDLAVVYRVQDRTEDAARLYLRALEILRDPAQNGARSGGPNPLLAVVLHNLGRLRTEQGHRKEGERLLREAIQRWEECWGPDHPDVAAGLTSLGVVLQSRGRLEEAGRLLDRASQIDRRSFPSDDLRIALDLNNTASLEAARKRYPDAERLLRQSVELLEKRGFADDPAMGRTLGNLGEVLLSEKKLGDAQQAFQRATEILTRAWGPGDRRLVEWMERYAVVLRKREDFVGAERVEMQVMRIRVANTLR